MKDIERVTVANSDEDHTPTCPACKARAERVGTHWETAHEVGCAWLTDPNSEPYS